MQITLVVGDGGTSAHPPGHPGAGLTLESGRVRLGRITVHFTTPAGLHEGLVAHSDAGLALLAGDPVHTGAGPVEARLQSLLRELATVADAEAAARAVGQLLSEFRGVFVAALIPASARWAVIAGDHLGVRPLYQAAQAGQLSLSTSLGRISASLPRRPVPDLVGVLQWSQSDTVWGRRTILEGVTRNRAAEIVVIGTAGTVSTHHYLDWTSLADARDPSLDDAAAEVLETFREAVRLRSPRGGEAVAFLSGGMDSRFLVSTLREQAVSVRTFGFAPLDTQDLLFAEAFASAAGVAHRSVPRRPSKRTDWGALMQHAVDSALADGWLASAPAAVWSGDGGSVGMGGVNVRPALVSAFAANDDRQVADVLLRKTGFGLPRLAATRGRRRELFDQVYADVQAEIRPLLGMDPGRAARTLLMLNDQRRHLDWYHERLAWHGIHYILPFYDRRLLTVLAALPFSLLERHQLYTRMFQMLGPPVTAVPYQTYPGHLPSLVAADRALKYQWQRPSRAWRSAADRGPLIAAGLEAVRSSGSRGYGLGRARIALATALHALGARDQTDALAFVSDLQISHGLASGSP